MGPGTYWLRPRARNCLFLLEEEVNEALRLLLCINLPESQYASSSSVKILETSRYALKPVTALEAAMNASAGRAIKSRLKLLTTPPVSQEACGPYFAAAHTQGNQPQRPSDADPKNQGPMGYRYVGVNSSESHLTRGNGKVRKKPRVF